MSERVETTGEGVVAWAKALVSDNARLREVLEQVLFQAISDKHGFTVATDMLSNGWVWPPSVQFVSQTHETACKLLRAADQEKPTGN